MPDVFKILRDLEMKAVGVDPERKEIPEGYFVSFRSVGLPIRMEDYANPFSPIGVNLDKPPAAPKEPPPGEPATGSSKIDTDRELQNITKSQRAFVNTFLLTDSKLRMNARYETMPGASKVSDSWWAIINGANGVPPKADIAPSLKAEYEAAAATLMDQEGLPTAKYQRYMEYRDKYRAKVKAYNRAYSTALTDPQKLSHWPADGVILQDEVNEAFDQWNSFGAKGQVEKALNTLASQGTDPAIALIARSKRRFQNSLLNFPGIGDIPWVTMSPTTWADPDEEDGWTTYTSTDFHTESHFRSSSTTYSGGGGFSIGLWSAGGGFDHTKSQNSLNVQTQNLAISFKYCIADIRRMGIDTSLLNLKNWFLAGDYAKGSISRGDMKQERPDKGEEVFLPSLISSVILVKDFRIKWDNWKSDWQQATTQTSAGASFGYACFALSGGYKHRNEDVDFTADASGEELRSTGIQLVGYVSEILPQSPGLNSSDYMQ
ncbi:hypothetical protein [Streptomyces chartreusis]|uniref:hypothetical protein n=1 Tax=Streptomyces chartreusis TaxID=1969 RepID=UPI002E809344|nr:hypothetical protein [Streptomyces chartreusis]WUB15195.1 hypothetical protein OG997_00110 [Streptomyces chartreusis]